MDGGKSSVTQCSKRDEQRRVNSLHGASSKFARMNPQKERPSEHVSEVVQSTRAARGDELEEPDQSSTVEPQKDGKQRVRKVGMNLTATSLFTCAQLCREWNHNNKFTPFWDALHVSRGDVLEIGGPPNSVLVNEVSKVKRSFFCVSQRTGFAPRVRSQESSCAGLQARSVIALLSCEW